MYDVGRILLIWLLCFLSVLLHELGHAWAAGLPEGKRNGKYVPDPVLRSSEQRSLLFAFSLWAVILIPGRILK
jgi:hypothetical protein